MKTLFLFVLTILLFSATANAKTLLWDANDDADSCVVYWGAESGAYTGHSEPLTDTRFVLPAAITGKDYFFAVKAFNTFGNSSDYSEERREHQLNIIINLRFETEITINSQ